MKTIEIQQQITALKGMIREWGTTKLDDDWASIALGLNHLVQVTFETMPTKVEIKEVEVIREVPITVEVVKEVFIEKPLVKEVAVEVPTTIYVPVFEQEK